MTKIRVLSPALAEMAERELNENEKRIAEDLESLKTWLVKQRHLKARTDDQFLIAFLRGCKHSIERAKEKLDMYYTIRTAIPEFFADRDPFDATIQKVLDYGVTLPLPEPQIDGSRIFLIKQGGFDPQKVNVTDVMKVSYMITDRLLWEDDSSVIAGQTILVDLSGLTMAHIGQMTPTLIKKMTSSIQEAYPIRQKGIHFINPSMGFEALFKMFCNFMSEKIRKRIHVHDSFETLHKHVPKRLLPTEYGGDIGPIQNILADWRNKLYANRNWFIDDADYRSDESKRIGRPKNGDLLFGTDGSFRKLEFD